MADGRGDLPKILLTVVIAFTILLLGLAVVNPVVETATDNSDAGEPVQTNVITDQGTGIWYPINRYAGVEPDVVTSRGYAVNLTGASDSYVESDSNLDVAADDTWTVSVWGRLDADASAEVQTALAVDGRLTIRYNQTSAEWVAWYYDDGSGDSYEIAVGDTSQPANWSNVQVVSNGTHLRIYQNNTAGESVQLDSGGVTDAPVNATNWNGRLEEVRTFDDALNASQRQAVVDGPVRPRPGTNRTARVMFDEPYADQQVILFSSASLETSNATFASGFAGETLDRGQYAATGGDYVWQESGPEIKLVSGGDGEGLPIVYVDYTLKKLSPTSWVSTVEQVWGLAALVPFIVIAGYLFTVLRARR